MKNKKGGKKTSFGGKLLEKIPHALTLLGFVQCLKDNPLNGSKVIIKNYPYETIYETPGRLEWMIRYQNDRYALECKYQNSGGSVDEKLPYIVENFRYGEFNKMIVVYDGKHWDGGRGTKAIKWLKRRAEHLDRECRKKLFVLTYVEFMNFAKRHWDKP